MSQEKKVEVYGEWSGKKVSMKLGTDLPVRGNQKEMKGRANVKENRMWQCKWKEIKMERKLNKIDHENKTRIIQRERMYVKRRLKKKT